MIGGVTADYARSLGRAGVRLKIVVCVSPVPQYLVIRNLLEWKEVMSFPIN